MPQLATHLEGENRSDKRRDEKCGGLPSDPAPQHGEEDGAAAQGQKKKRVSNKKWVGRNGNNGGQNKVEEWAQLNGERRNGGRNGGPFTPFDQAKGHSQIALVVAMKHKRFFKMPHLQ